MESFVVSARKYRPLGFDEVVGQGHITTTLKNAIDNNHLAQALLFCGPRGVGKTTCARILARMVNGFEASGENQSTNFNIHELDAASNNSVDDIRSLTDQVRYPPQQGKFKVYIIDEVHMLSTQAFNAFLKTLEEPPEYAIFILATTEKHKVIPTILSRCQIYDFNRIEIKDIVDQLKKIAAQESIEAEDEALHLIAQKADGAMRDALSLFDLIVTFSSDNKITYQNTIKNLHILDYDYYFKVTDFLQSEEMSKALLLFDEVLKNGFDGHNFLAGLQDHFRNLLVAKDEETVKLMEVSEGLKQKYLEQGGALNSSYLLTGLNLMNQFDLNYKVSRNQRLHVELCLMKLSHLNQAIRLAEQNSEDGVKKKSRSELKEEVPSQVKTKAPEKEETSKEQPLINKTQTDQKLSPEPPDRELPPPEPEKPVPATPKINPVIDRISTGPKETPSLSRRSENNATIEEVEEGPKEESDSFGEEALQGAWEKFRDIRKKAGAADTEMLVLNRKVEKTGEHNVKIFLSSALEVSILERIEQDMVQHFRKELNNTLIQLEKEILEQETTKKLYTSKEKFEYMVQQNPALKDLKEKLGLDFDF